MRLAIIATLAAAALAAGCATTPEQQAPVSVEERAAKPAPVETKPIARVDLTSKPAAANPLKDPNNILSKRSIYFDFDKYDIKDEFRPQIEAHAKYLRENPGAKMLMQGNADERGSREYNLGLGQRRSDSVKRALTLLGAKDNQIESVSLGEEKPVCTEHAEDCWAKNRRGDMLYNGEY
ncbi:MAG TPA: peptidoglycan-associated lipoprotein Pal [Burkholderiales bacterium]|nr:peptidoglycan-associated lipoprotein Pal [Burkholderiales bacterium]